MRARCGTGSPRRFIYRVQKLQSRRIEPRSTIIHYLHAVRERIRPKPPQKSRGRLLDWIIGWLWFHCTTPGGEWRREKNMAVAATGGWGRQLGMAMEWWPGTLPATHDLLSTCFVLNSIGTLVEQSISTCFVLNSIGTLVEQS
jgi:hypothetical protein